MAQKTAWTGAVLTESDINTYLMHEGGAWSTYTPTLTQSATPTKTVTYAHYGRAGRLIYGNVRLDITATPGTAANALIVGLPVAAHASIGNVPIGTGWISDSSASLFYSGVLVAQTTTTALIYPSAGGANVLGITGFTAAIASGDIVGFSFCYEAAS
jgi:hypothetical protein